MKSLGWAGLGAVGLLVVSGCASGRGAVAERGTGGSGPGDERAALEAPAARKYVDAEFGFEIAPMESGWVMDTTGVRTPEGLAIPVVMRHDGLGAQVVLQVAPAVASPTQFAERLTLGLRSQPGFTTSDPEPLPDSESAVGFRFAMGDAVEGRVMVQEGSPGHIFLFMGTWPAGSPEGTAEQVGAVFKRVHVLPEAKAQALPRPPPAFPGDV